MSAYFNLGPYQRSISTRSSEAQNWFNRGLVWCYGFNQEEAVRCFEKVVELDPQCAMGHWGIAYAAGPFYNKPWHWFGDSERIETIRFCHQHAMKAHGLREHASPLEQGLIEAICCKHPAAAADDDAELKAWNLQYAETMRRVYIDFPGDLDVICLTAEALVNLTPWKLWNLQTGNPADGAATLEAIDILEHGLDLVKIRQALPHPGLLHFYIHVYEMSPTPEKALPYADQLRDLCPDIGHLRHMASHIDSLCGHWQNAADANDRAINADRDYMELRGRDEFYMISVVHNYDFKIWASMFLGQFEQALQAADDICNLVRDKRSLEGNKWYLTSTLEGYYGGRAHVLVRFGKWQAICDEDMPDNPDEVPITTILLVYAKAIAYATLGNLEVAREYVAEFERRLEQIPEWHIMANNPTRNILAVGTAMMHGEVEYHAGNHEHGFQLLREATVLSDNLEYSEPWPWMHPPRHALGALLMEQGQIEEALHHYEDDLGIDNRLPRCAQHPDNIWALHGYHECLQRLGRGREAALVKPRLDELMRNADIAITSSCCCRKS
ncbi:MAG: tetratricopeptide repeat protein [Pseudomonadota bacterium]